MNDRAAQSVAGAAQPRWRGRVFHKARVTTPTVLQMEAAECGAAALAIVLGYHGRHVPLDELRAACGVSRDGSKATHLLQAARQYGLEGRGYTTEVDALRNVRLPAILFWEFSHYVVLEGFGRDAVYLNDPAKGRRTVSREQFDQSFTGIVLAFRKTDAFRIDQTGRSVARSLDRCFAGGRSELACLVLCAIALAVSNVVIAAAARLYVDDVLVRGLDVRMRPIVAALAFAAVSKGTLTYLQQRLLTQLGTRIVLRSTVRFVWHVLHLPVSFFSQRHVGEIASRVGVNDRLATRLSGELITSLVNVLACGIYIAVLVRFDQALTAVAGGIAVTNLLALRYVSRKTSDVRRNQQTAMERAAGVSMQGLQVIETLKSMGGESDYFIRWAGHHANVLNADQDLGRARVYVRFVPALLNAASFALLLVVGGLRIIDGAMTIGTLVAFQIVIVCLTEPVSRLVNLEQQIQDTNFDLDRLEDVLRSPRDANTTLDAGDAAERLEGSVDLKDVTFGYSRLDPPVLRGLSLSVRPGQRVALVGASGSGKSTVAKVIAGLYEPWSGEVLFDGRPRSAMQRSTIANALAIVEQDAALLRGTVRENLGLWDSTLPAASVVSAAKDAQIHDEILQRRGGYDHEVEESGANFSGGQRQRLDIARALTANPRILILDEATSGLDPCVERLVDSSLRRRDCTCVIIAHRLSTIRDCDQILVLDRGAVVQRGRHDELASVDGPYRRLIVTA